MKSRRRNSARTRPPSPVVARLGRKRPRRRVAAGGFLQVEPVRGQAHDHALRFRLLVSAGFALALLVGVYESRPVIQRVEQSARRGAPVLVRSVAVQGNHRLSASAVALASGVARDSLASRLDPQRIARTLEQHPLIRSASATLLPGGELLVRIEERDPVALLRGRAAEGEPVAWRLVDSTGTPIAQARAEDWSRLPRFRTTRVLATGAADATLLEAIDLASLVDRHHAPTLAGREIELPAQGAGTGWVLHSQTLPHRVILGKTDLEPRLERLAMLLDADLDAARGMTEIDLRFADQAVLRTGSSSR